MQILTDGKQPPPRRGRSSGSRRRRRPPTVLVRAAGEWLLLAFAPVVIVVWQRNPAFLPLLLLPMVGVYRSMTVSLDKEHQATHDVLTDLPNRLLFDRRVDEVLAASRRRTDRVGVLLMDLDRFKEVNDTLGHAAGDDLLHQVGSRLIAALPPEATIARFGGDEFAVLMPGLSDDAEALAAAQVAGEALGRPFTVSGCRLEVEASVGLAIYPQHGRDRETLVQRADQAMYLAKSNHRLVEVYDSEKHHGRRRRLGLLGDLRPALVAREFELHYQPKVDLRTNEVASVEALVRWHHPEHGLLAPVDFVPMAEHTGLIRPLTTYVLAEAAAQARRWRDGGLELSISVNLSARSLVDLQLAHEVEAVLDQRGLDPADVEIEITERSIMSDPVRARRSLVALDQLGIGLIIDDFGTGYSSITYLQQLPVKEVKIDQSFVMGMVDNDADRVIVQSAIDLATNLGLEVTAEGVETAESLRILELLGCDKAQGYLISRPLPAPALGPWVEAWRAAGPIIPARAAGEQPDRRRPARRR